jgi:aldose 1-epimerase
VRATVTYRLTDDNALVIDYEATTDRPTVINLTQHSYFNLGAGQASDVLSHELTVNADRYTPVDDGLIPTGDLAPVEGTPFDFRTPTSVGARIHLADPQLGRGEGYDHNYVLNRKPDDRASRAAHLLDPRSGRTLEVFTTQPGMQLYTANHLSGTITGKGGVRYGPRAGLCLETQSFPDSPNHPNFPSTVLRPGETFKSRTIWRFGIHGEAN